MEKSQIETFETILDLEDNLISEIALIQKNIHDAVLSKSWENLTLLINNMKDASSDFEKIDLQRDELQREMTSAELRPYSKKLLIMRSKLSQSKIQNQVLNDYISITRGFINGVLDKASTKTYSRYGQIVQKQPVSVLVSAHY